MAQVIKHYCDWKDCKKERAGDRRIQVFSHSCRDASGNGTERWHAVFDLCVEHLFDYTETLIEMLERTGMCGPVKPNTPFEVAKDLKIKFELN